MIIVTYYFYIATALLIIGLIGLFLRRHPLVSLLSGQMMFLAVQLFFVVFARIWGQNQGQVMATILGLVAMIYFVLTLQKEVKNQDKS